jgi:hypothetical protein
VVLVNRSVSASKSVKVNFNNFDLADQAFTKLSLSNLSSSETFNSHTSNALVKTTVTATANSISLSLPPMSVTTLQLKGTKGDAVTGTVSEEEARKILEVFPNPVLSDKQLTVAINLPGTAELELLDAMGNKVRGIYQGQIKTVPFKTVENLSTLARGAYFLRLQLNGRVITRKVFLL